MPKLKNTDPWFLGSSFGRQVLRSARHREGAIFKKVPTPDPRRKTHQGTTQRRGQVASQVAMSFLIIFGFLGRLCSTEVAFLLPTQQPLVWIPARPKFFSLLLSLWTVMRSNPSSAMQWISQMQLPVTSWAKYYKKIFGLYLVFFFVNTSLPQVSTRWVPLALSSLCPLFLAVLSINLSNIKR